MHDKLLDNYEYKGLHKFFSQHIRGVKKIDSSKIVEDYCVDLIDRLLKNPGEISNFMSSVIDTICKILDDREPFVDNKVNEYIFVMRTDKSKQKMYQDILKAFMKLSYVPFQLLVFGIMDSTNLLLMDLEVEIMSTIMKDINDDEKKKIHDELMSDFNNYKESILKCGDVMKSSISNVEDVKLLLDTLSNSLILAIISIPFNFGIFKSVIIKFTLFSLNFEKPSSPSLARIISPKSSYNIV
jgi:hypothetical protein